MEITPREGWTVIHGMVFGAIFLLAFAGGLAGLYSLRPEWLSLAGLKERIVRIQVGMWAMAIAAWGTVLTGTYIVYPWYRAKAPAGTPDLGHYPRALLLANPHTAEWHNFGMEWKEHIAWIVPIVATVVAFIVSYYGPVLAKKLNERRIVTAFYTIAFAAAGIAGMFGAFLNKVAPVH